MRSLIEPPGFWRFELEVQLAEAGVEALGLDDRRVADQFEYGLVDGHADLRRGPAAAVHAAGTRGHSSRTGHARAAAVGQRRRMRAAVARSTRAAAADEEGRRRPRR